MFRFTHTLALLTALSGVLLAPAQSQANELLWEYVDRYYQDHRRPVDLSLSTDDESLLALGIVGYAVTVDFKGTDMLVEALDEDASVVARLELSSAHLMGEAPLAQSTMSVGDTIIHSELHDEGEGALRIVASSQSSDWSKSVLLDDGASIDVFETGVLSPEESFTIELSAIMIGDLTSGVDIDSADNCTECVGLGMAAVGLAAACVWPAWIACPAAAAAIAKFEAECEGACA